MDPHLLKQLNAERNARRAALLLTDLGDGRDRLIKKGDTVAGELGEAVTAAFRSGKSQVVETDGRRYFLNVHLPAARLVIIGAVHISQALAPMAQMAGFSVSVIDPRTAFATPERFEGVDLSSNWPDEALRDQPLDAFCGLAALTHDPKIDDQPLKQALEAGCFYVGALGSRKTHATRLERLHQQGVKPEDTARISAPVGLDIGAASPPEIAVAVLADFVAALRKPKVGSA